MICPNTVKMLPSASPWHKYSALPVSTYQQESDASRIAKKARPWNKTWQSGIESIIEHLSTVPKHCKRTHTLCSLSVVVLISEKVELVKRARCHSSLEHQQPPTTVHSNSICSLKAIETSNWRCQFARFLDRRRRHHHPPLSKPQPMKMVFQDHQYLVYSFQKRLGEIVDPLLRYLSHPQMAGQVEREA